MSRDPINQLNKIFSEMSAGRNNYKPEECFKKSSCCSKKLINSHSIQKEKLLRTIANNNHVIELSYVFSDNKLSLNDRLKGINKASIFCSFCGNHDDRIFKPIEAFDYKVGDKQQEFLFAYRALAKEYFTKKAVYTTLSSSLNKIKSDALISKLVDLGHLEAHKHTVGGSIKFFEELRTAFNTNLDRGRFNKIETCVFIFPTQNKIVANSAFTLNKDLEGNTINDCIKSKVKLLFINVFYLNSKTYILLAHLKKDKNVFENFANQINGHSKNQQQLIISSLLISYCENIYFAPSTWNRFDKAKKLEIINLYDSTIEETRNSQLISVNNNRNVNLFV